MKIQAHIVMFLRWLRLSWRHRQRNRVFLSRIVARALTQITRHF